MIDTDLRSELLAILGGEAAVAQCSIDQGTEFPYVWIERANEFTERLLDGTPWFVQTSWNVEIVSTSLPEALELAAEIKAELDDYLGPLGDSYAYRTEVTDHSDSYVPENGGDDVYVAALNIVIET